MNFVRKAEAAKYMERRVDQLVLRFSGNTEARGEGEIRRLASVIRFDSPGGVVKDWQVKPIFDMFERCETPEHLIGALRIYNGIQSLYGSRTADKALDTLVKIKDPELLRAAGMALDRHTGSGDGLLWALDRLLSVQREAMSRNPARINSIGEFMAFYSVDISSITASELTVLDEMSGWSQRQLYFLIESGKAAEIVRNLRLQGLSR